MFEQLNVWESEVPRQFSLMRFFCDFRFVSVSIFECAFTLFDSVCFSSLRSKFAQCKAKSVCAEFWVHDYMLGNRIPWRLFNPRSRNAMPSKIDRSAADRHELPSVTSENLAVAQFFRPWTSSFIKFAGTPFWPAQLMKPSLIPSSHAFNADNHCKQIMMAIMVKSKSVHSYSQRISWRALS